MKVSHGLLAALMLTFAIPVCAQSLGELAKQEQERRKTTPPAGKTYTDDDLKKIYVPPVAPPATDAPAKEGAATEAGKAGDGAKAGDAAKNDAAKEDAAKLDEAAWHARMEAAREALRQSQMFRDALQSQINGLTADFTSRDDPAQRAQIADNRQKALEQLDKTDADIVKAKQGILDVEEAARRASVPPGWIR